MSRKSGNRFSEKDMRKQRNLECPPWRQRSRVVADIALERIPIRLNAECALDSFRAFPDNVDPFRSSLPGLTRQSILFVRRWMRGSSPRMTVERPSQPNRETL